MVRQGTTRLDRDAVIQIAAEIINEEGLGALSLKRVAAKAGVTQPALYRHVESLDDVWRALGLAARADLAAVLSEATIGLSGSDAVHAVANAWRQFARQHPGRYRSTERWPVRGDAELEAAVQQVVEVLALSLRSYELSDDDVAHAARLLRSALHGFVSFELGDGHPFSPEIDVTFDRLIDMLIAGFESAATRGQ